MVWSTDKKCGERCIYFRKAWRRDYAARLFGKSLKDLPKLARWRANLSEQGNAAGIAACETTAKAISIAMRLCICVGNNDFQVA